MVRFGPLLDRRYTDPLLSTSLHFAPLQCPAPFWSNVTYAKSYVIQNLKSRVSPQIEQAAVRPSLQNALEGHTISRRSAAAGCADAQATPQSSREALRHRLRVLNELGPATQRRSTLRSTRWQHQRQRQQHSSRTTTTSRRSSSTSRAQHQDCSMPIGRRSSLFSQPTLTVFYGFLLERAIFNAKFSSPAARL